MWEKTGLDADVVIPVPDSSRPCALSMSFRIKRKYREGLVKNRYIGRTFIMPGQTIRKASIKHKLSPIGLELKGKNVLVVDDSIVRGNTSRKIIDMIRDAGAKKVYFASSCPPIKFPCVYGIDMVRKSEFIAANNTIEEIKKKIGADFLLYQTLDGLKRSAKRGNPAIKEFCAACMDGDYPTHDIDNKVLMRMGNERTESKRNTKTE